MHNAFCAYFGTMDEEKKPQKATKHPSKAMIVQVHFEQIIILLQLLSTYFLCFFWQTIYKRGKSNTNVYVSVQYSPTVEFENKKLI